MSNAKHYEWLFVNIFKAKVVTIRYSILKAYGAFAFYIWMGGFPSGQRGQTVNLLR